MRSIKVSKYQRIISAAAIGICILVTGLAGLSFAATPPLPPLAENGEETIEIETFYPSPWAEYNELHLYPHLEETVCNSSDREGLMYYDKDEHTVKVCNWSGTKYDWQKVSIGSSGGSLATSTATARPACDSSTLGLMVFDTSSDRPYVCSANGVWKTAGWTDKDFVMAVHSSAQCTGSGGTIVDDGTGNKFCKFSGGGCPGGWMRYSNWSTTQNTQCETCQDLFSCCGPSSANSGSHNWADSPVENISYTMKLYKNGGHCQSETHECQASITYIGCY